MMWLLLISYPIFCIYWFSKRLGDKLGTDQRAWVKVLDALASPGWILLAYTAATVHLLCKTKILKK
jgi:hypothetical protein